MAELVVDGDGLGELHAARGRDARDELVEGGHASPRAPPQKFCDTPNASFMGGTAKSYSKSQVDTFQKKNCK